MIESGLVYIHSAPNPSGFIGCGAIVEGPFVVTCRHVWKDAKDASSDGKVCICFPPPRGEGKKEYRQACIADPCDADEDPLDLVILSADIPPANAALPLARDPKTESGAGYALAGLQRPGGNGAAMLLEVTITGEIAARIGGDRLRQFTGDAAEKFWLDYGSSGSPVCVHGRDELAAIVIESETGERSGEAKKQVAFVLPASTIHRYLRHHIGREAARAHGIDPARVPQILKNLGAADISIAEIRLRLEGYIADIKSFIAETKPVSAEVPPPSNRGGDIDAAIAKSQKLAADFRPGEAMDVLDRQIADEKADRRQRLVPLLEEKARQQRLLFNHEAAKATLTELLALDPEQIWRWIDLGDLHETTGSLTDAGLAFKAGLEAARTVAGEDPHDKTKQRDIIALLNRLGDIQKAQGDLQAALTSFRAAMQIAENLAKTDPHNTAWQRDLSVSHNKIGDIQQARGDLQGALASFQADMQIAENLAKTDPRNTEWQRDLSISHNKIGVIQQAQGDTRAALASFQATMQIAENLAKTDPRNTQWQRDLALSLGYLAGAEIALHQAEPARLRLRRAEDILQRLIEISPHDASLPNDLAWLRTLLKTARP